MDNFNGVSPDAQKVMKTLAQEAAFNNAQQLMEKISEHCFEKCVPTPGSSLSGGETACFQGCMEKYLGAWQTVRGTYVERIKQRSGSL